jgi:predicted permease
MKMILIGMTLSIRRLSFFLDRGYYLFLSISLLLSIYFISIVLSAVSVSDPERSYVPEVLKLSTVGDKRGGRGRFIPIK